MIGLGGLAQSQHVPNIHRSAKAELHAICDLDSSLLQQVGDLYHVRRRTRDVTELLQDPELEGVVIATREDSHVPLTLAALQAGKHVYVEKPLAEDPEEARRVAEARQRSGRAVLVGMNRRCAPAYVRARELLRAHGGPRNMFYRIADTYSTSWGKRFGSGNRMLHELCHVFDILRYFADSEVEEIYCRSQRDDDESLLLTFASGCTAVILSSGYATYETPKEHFEAVAECGMLCVEEFVELRLFGLPGAPGLVECFAGHAHPQHDDAHVRAFAEKGYPALLEFRRQIARQTADPTLSAPERQRLAPINYAVDKGWQAAIDHFADVIRHAVPQMAASEIDGLRATEITRAALESRRRRVPVAVRRIAIDSCAAC